MIETLRLIILLIELGILAVQDFMYKKISLRLLVFMSMAAVILRIAGVIMCREEIMDDMMLIGVVFGIGIIVLGYFVNVIGIGDGMVVLLMSLMAGGRMAISTFLFAMTIAAVTAVFLLMFKRVKRTYEFPFVPFLFFSLLGGVICM